MSILTELERGTVPFSYATGVFELPQVDLESIYLIYHRSSSNHVINKNFQKLELKSCNEEPRLSSLFELPDHPELLEYVKSFFPSKQIFFDKNFDGGGLTFTGPGGFLRYHNDFPYSTLASAYRIFNLIFYLSTDDIMGGDLHLIDSHSKTVEKIISPVRWRYVAFPTSQYTPHGFSKIVRGIRVSLNAYYYSDAPLDGRFQACKTEWF